MTTTPDLAPDRAAATSQRRGVTLPAAPRVARAIAAPVRRRRAPAVVLVVLGLALVIVPVAGGLFVKAASGQQLIDAFAPHVNPDALDRYDNDLAILRDGATAVDTVYDRGAVRAGRFPGVDEYRTQADAIDARAVDLLTRIRAAEPDYRQVAGIGGFDRVPFLVVAAGLALTYAGVVLLRGRRSRAAGATLLAVAASVALIGYPFVSDLPAGGQAGERLLHALAPVMTPATVQQQQRDFVALVHAVGELDTSFRAVPRSGAAAEDLARLVKAWPAVSSDLAALVGAINDNLPNDQALDDLDGLTRDVGASGLVALPWFLAGAGALGVLAAAAAALPRYRKETT